MTTAQPGTRIHNTLMPKVDAPLRTLGIAMTVMCYLACLAIGGLLLINRAVDAWTSDISGQVTVQIRPIEGVDMDAQLAGARDILKATPGITSVNVLDKKTAAKLLEPWLGKSRVLEELPIPRLISLVIDRKAPPDFDALAAQLSAKVNGASLDTHRRWQAELTSMASALIWLGLAVLALIAGSTVALVIYATRAALDANREVIEVLYLVGARDQFIARQVERRFLITGVRAGLIGAAAGIGSFALISLTGVFATPSGFSEASRALLLGPPGLTVRNYLIFLLVPILATPISVITARLSVHRILKVIGI